MKNKLTYLFFLFAIVLQSCEKETNIAEPINIEYQLEVDKNVVPFDVPYQKAEIVLTNKTNNEKYTAKASADGKVLINGIIPGAYAVNVSLKLTAAEVTSISGVSTSEDLSLNFSADNQMYSGSNQSTTIRLVTSRPIGNFVFKQIYYAGSNISKGAGIRDMFVEIYNNSSETLYADSLCFVVVYGKTNNSTDGLLLPNLQYDWTKSLNMSVPDDANEDYVYAKAMFMVPSDGTGKKYPIEAGKSFTIAGTAIDHTKPYTLNSDKVQEIEDATLTVDLSKTDFEVYMYPYEQKVQPGRAKFASDIDNPSVSDVETLFATGMRDLILNPQGKDSYLLFKSGGQNDPNNFPKFAAPDDKVVTDKTVYYPQIPLKYALDAVEAGAIIEKDKTPRRLPLAMDAGSVSVTGGPYSSQSVVRKTKQIVNGRRILMDTNNSSQDFGVLTKADPSKGNSSFID